MQNIAAIEENEIFELAYRFVTETGENIFLTGNAGTGKTTFLKYLKANTAKQTVIAAPTGVAAINANGVTLHSLFQLPFNPFLPTASSRQQLVSKLRFNARRLELLRKMELLVIDEISMVRCDVLDAIDAVLRFARKKQHLPFGGVQMLFIGDLYQLPPVAGKEVWSILQQHYNSRYFFDSHVLKEQMPLLIELKKIYRQNDQSFVALLNKVRNNNMTPDDFEDLHHRYKPGFLPKDDHYITLTSRNNQADLVNYRELQRLNRPPFTYSASIQHDFPPQMYPIDAELVLKEGAQVMFVKNDSERKYFNGKIGVIQALTQQEITVNCDGVEIPVKRETWTNIRYSLDTTNGKINESVLGSFTQFPLRLAWAITIHKSQGLTFEKVMIDAGESFDSGQVYVALSRCKSLEGIVLLSKIPPSAILNDENVLQGQHALSPKGSLVERFEGARLIFVQQLLEEIFSFEHLHASVINLNFKLKDHEQNLSNGSLNWATEIRNAVEKERDTGLSFLRQLYTMLKTEPAIERNTAVHERLNRAGDHFVPILQEQRRKIQHHPLVTEHLESANAIDDALNNLLRQFDYYLHLLSYCQNPFSVLSFLNHKLAFTPTKSKLSAYATGKRQYSGENAHVDLFDALKQWRDATVETQNLPVFMVANQQSLSNIASYLPMTAADLLKLPGFGEAKVDKFGAEILGIVEAYCREHNLQSNMSSFKSSRKRERSSQKPRKETISTKEISFKLFKEGKSVDEIALARDLTPSTIEGHLCHYIANEALDITQLISSEKFDIINSAIGKNAEATFTQLKDILPAEITFGEIRMVMASRPKNQSVPGEQS